MPLKKTEKLKILKQNSSKIPNLDKVWFCDDPNNNYQPEFAYPGGRAGNQELLAEYSFSIPKGMYFKGKVLKFTRISFFCNKININDYKCNDGWIFDDKYNDLYSKNKSTPMALIKLFRMLGRNIDKESVMFAQPGFDESYKAIFIRIQEDWDEILENIRNDYDMLNASFKILINPLRLFDLINNELLIIVPDKIYKRFLVKFTTILRDVLEKRYDNTIEIHYITAQEAKIYVLNTNDPIVYRSYSMLLDSLNPDTDTVDILKNVNEFRTRIDHLRNQAVGSKKEKYTKHLRYLNKLMLCEINTKQPSEEDGYALTPAD